MRSTLFVPTAALAVAALALTGCSPGAPIEPVTLTLAHVDGGPELDPAVGWFVDRVAELSDGAITIEVAYGCCGDTVDVEELLVATVADGSADLGWFGTRVLGDLGVTATAALTAPLLVDSYELQAAVLGSSAATTALEAIAELGVDPIAFAPGTLRRPLASTGPVLSVADWKGATVASFHSAQNAEAFTALGARPVDVTFAERDAGIFDGSIQVLENSLTALDSDRESTLPYTTANVALWPRVSAIIGNNDAMADLGAGGRAILQQAAADVGQLVDDFVELDAAALASACEGGARFSEADSAQLAELEDAFAGVYDGLRDDSDASVLFAAIVELKGSLVTEGAPTVPVECTGAPPAAGGSATGDVAELNGAFRTVQHTADSVLAAGFSADDANGVAGAFTLTFDNGGFRLLHDAATGDKFGCEGSYTVGGGRVDITVLPGGDCGPGGRLFETAYSVDAQQLVFSDLVSPAEIDVFLFSSQPLARIG